MVKKATKPAAKATAPAAANAVPAKSAPRQQAKPASKVVIPPGIGRKVWFQPARDHQQGTDAGEIVQHDRLDQDKRQPLDATVVYVRSDRAIDVRVTDHVGKVHFLPNVPLLQDGDDVPKSQFAYWMPYQIGQAKKSA